MKLDSKSKLVLFSLLENSRLSFRQIAKKINCSAPTVLNKVRELEKEGIIKHYSTLLDYDKLGFELQAVIDVKVSEGKLFEVEKQLARNTNIQSVYDLTGDFDVLVLAKFRKRKELDNFVKKIQTMEFVERTHTRIILNTIKEGFVYP